jgi:hypothetical protein
MVRAMFLLRITRARSQDARRVMTTLPSHLRGLLGLNVSKQAPSIRYSSFGQTTGGQGLPTTGGQVSQVYAFALLAHLLHYDGRIGEMLGR